MPIHTVLWIVLQQLGITVFGIISQNTKQIHREEGGRNMQAWGHNMDPKKLFYPSIIKFCIWFPAVCYARQRFHVTWLNYSYLLYMIVIAATAAQPRANGKR